MVDVLAKLDSWSFIGNPASRWLIALAVAAATSVVVLVVTRWSARRLKVVAAHTETPIDDMMVELLSQTRGLFFAAVGLWAGSKVLTLSAAPSRGLNVLVIAAVILQITSWSNRAITLWLARERSTRVETDPGAITTLQGLSYVLRVVVWSACLLLLLENFGVDVTALVATLGVGGIAVALAVQNVLGDLFASLSIALDKPFVLGDFVVVGDHMGTIERVGLKTTRIRSLSGEQLVFSNSDLLSSRIRNFKRMEERRIVFSVGVTYQTPVDLLEAIPGMVREIIEETENTRFDRAHFKAFGDSAYLFEFVFYVLSAEYPVYMDIQQAINLAICRRFAEHGIEIAYPTRTLYLATPAPEVMPSADRA